MHSRYASFCPHFWALSQNCGERLLASSCLSFCPSARNNSAPTGRIFIKFDIWGFFEICQGNSSFIKIWQQYRVPYMKTDVYFFITSRLVPLRMRNVSDKICRENQETHFVFSKFFFFRKSCRLWENVGKYGNAGQATDDNMAHSHCMLDI